MIFLILIVIYIISLIMSFSFFKKIFNPLSVYATIWFFLISLYEIRLINYDIISSQVWVVIGGAYFAFFSGILIPFFLYGSSNFERKDSQNELFYRLYSEKINLIKYLIIFFSIVGLYSTLQHWSVLLSMFGSIPKVLLNSPTIYRMRISGELEGVIPYIFVSSYIAIFLVAVYSAYLKKFSILALIPFFSIVFKGIASVGRQGILFGFLEFLTTYIVASYYFSQFREKKILSKKGTIILILFAAIFIVSVVLIKDFRGSTDSYSGETRQLKALKNNTFISPTIYFYLSSDLGVLNKYYEKGVEENRIGENTFQLVYNILAKFGITERAQIYQKGYYIPQWTNTGTYLRELDVDFGVVGVYLIPFLLGFFSYYYWYFFMKTGNPVHLVLLIHLWLIIWFSFLMMITRGANWFLGLILLIIVFYLLPKINLPKRFSKKLS